MAGAAAKLFTDVSMTHVRQPFYSAAGGPVRAIRRLVLRGMAILAMSPMGILPMLPKTHGEDTGKMPVILMGGTPMPHF
jgi:hypothetical protein